MITPVAMALDATAWLVRESCPSIPGLVIDDCDAAAILWACFRNGQIVGGVYPTHATASRTILEFPAYFADVTIRPVLSVYAGGRAPYFHVPIDLALEFPSW